MAQESLRSLRQQFGATGPVAVEDAQLQSFKNSFDKLADVVIKSLTGKVAASAAEESLKKLLEAKNAAVKGFIDQEKEKEGESGGGAPHPHTALHTESGSMHSHVESQPQPQPVKK
jgi:hypothetical protein